MVGVMKGMAASFKRTSARTAVFSAPTPWQATVDPHLRQRLLDTHRHVWLSLLWGHCSFLLGPGVHKALFVPFKSLFPQSCGSPIIKSQWPPSQIPWGFLVPLTHPQAGKSVVGPRTFTTVQELLFNMWRIGVCQSQKLLLFSRYLGIFLLICHSYELSI